MSADKKELVFAQVRSEPIDTTRCLSCRNMVETTDHPRQIWVYDENGQVLPQAPQTKRSFTVMRCKVDHIVRVMARKPPALYPSNTPVRTCREVQLDECQGGKLYEPIH